MPKKITPQQRQEIIAFAKANSQTSAAKQFGVSRNYVNCIINKRSTTGKRRLYTKERCPITGF